MTVQDANSSEEETGSKTLPTEVPYHRLDVKTTIGWM